jgi:hypothetical protein
MSYDPTFKVTPPVDSSAVANIHSKIRDWVTSRWLVDLVSMYGGDISYDGSTGEILDHLEAFSEIWDFRRIARERGAATDDAVREGKGSARWLSATTDLGADAENRIIENAKRLGLLEGQDPSESIYDYIVVLGGARLSCKLRCDRAAEVICAGVRTAKVVLLGAARPVADSERDATDTYAPAARDEFDLIVAGARSAFNLGESPTYEDRHDDPENRNLSWAVTRFQVHFGGLDLDISGISAPSSDPLQRRANSADTIVFFLEREKVLPASKLLLITSQIYVPYVQLEALRTVCIPRGLWIETIGYGGDRMPQLQGLSNANHYLQEVRSTIQAARRFYQAYPE